MSDGSVTIDAILNSETFKKGLGSLGKIATTGLKAIAGVAATTTAAFDSLVAASVSARGEIEQQIGGTKAVFGDYAEEVQRLAKESYSKMGTSANDYMATMNKMGSLMQGSGIDIKTSMDLSSQAMQRAADVASIMGIDINSAMESIAGAAKGNFTMMDNLGVAMNATTLESYALSKGIKKSYTEMQNSEKIQLAMEMFLEKTTYAMGNYEAENKTFAGSLNTLKASFQNFLGGVGDFGTVVDSAVNFIGILVEKVAEATSQIVTSIVDAMPQILEQVGIIFQSIFTVIMDNLPMILDSASLIITQLVQGLTDNLPQIIDATMQIIQMLLKTLMDNFPKIVDMGLKLILELAAGIGDSLPELIPQIVDCILLIVDTLIDNIDLVIDAGIKILLGLTEGIINALPRLVQKIPEIIKKIITVLSENMPKIFQAGGKIIGELATGLLAMIPDVVSAMWDIGNTIRDKVLDLPGEALSWGKDIIAGFVDGIKSKINAVANSAQNIADKIKSILHFSRPDEGPLRDYETWMPDMVHGLSASMIKAIPEIEKASMRLADKMRTTVELETSKMSANLNSSATMNRMLTAYININSDIYMDKEKVGRTITPEVSKNLRAAGV